MKKRLPFDVLRETLYNALQMQANFEYLYKEYRRDLNSYFRFSVNGKFVGFSGLVLFIQKSVNCTLEFAMVLMRDVYNRAMRSTKDLYKFSAFGLTFKFYAK